ncbi:disulfide bond formation protein DsbB [Sphingomonas zeicaulis]|uniref:disulfide bond formation protein B n=1 Tax=Sphingomonas zeicaulis TaxID=1632740 RepID=UPI003D20ECCB
MSARQTGRVLALIIPAALLGGALISQYGFGLHPCEMCYWQRWPHEVAIGAAILGLLLGRRSAGTALAVVAAIAILSSGAIGVFHAGVEYHWWEGLTTCSTVSTGGGLQAIMDAPLIRCDQAQWTLAGISLAGFNAIFSILGGGLVLWLLGRKQGGFA